MPREAENCHAGGLHERKYFTTMGVAGSASGLDLIRQQSLKTLTAGGRKDARSLAALEAQGFEYARSPEGR